MRSALTGAAATEPSCLQSSAPTAERPQCPAPAHCRQAPFGRNPIGLKSVAAGRARQPERAPARQSEAAALRASTIGRPIGPMHQRTMPHPRIGRWKDLLPLKPKNEPPCFPDITGLQRGGALNEEFLNRLPQPVQLSWGNFLREQLQSLDKAFAEGLEAGPAWFPGAGAFGANCPRRARSAVPTRDGRPEGKSLFPARPHPVAGCWVAWDIKSHDRHQSIRRLPRNSLMRENGRQASNKCFRDGCPVRMTSAIGHRFPGTLRFAS